MAADERFRLVDHARIRAGLAVQDLWLRYVALGGTNDAFDLDGYLQGLVEMGVFQQDVLAQAVNEALDDRYRADCVPMSTPRAADEDDERLARVVNQILWQRPAPLRSLSRPPEAEQG